MALAVLAVVADASLYVSFTGDTGKLLSRCNGCGPGAYADSASVHQSKRSPSSTWVMNIVGKDKVTLKSNNGKLLARCNGCWRGGAYPDSAFVHATSAAPWATWTIVGMGNGKVALKADTGKYLARCNGCVRGGAYPDFAFVHVTNPKAAYAQWEVNYHPSPAAAVYPEEKL